MLVLAFMLNRCCNMLHFAAIVLRGTVTHRIMVLHDGRLTVLTVTDVCMSCHYICCLHSAVPALAASPPDVNMGMRN